MRVPALDDRRRVQNCDAAVARGEGAFSFLRGRELRGRDGAPVFAVVGCEKFEFQFAGFVGNGVAEDDAVLAVPECHRVEESLGIRVGELKLPVLSGVGGVVDAGLVAGSGRHQERFVGRESDDAAKVERGGVRDLGERPGAASVGGAEISAVRAAGPRNLAGDGADAAQAFGGMGELDARAGLRQCGGGEQQREQGAHGVNCRRNRRLEQDIRVQPSYNAGNVFF